jgi:hypothetical protein
VCGSCMSRVSYGAISHPIRRCFAANKWLNSLSRLSAACSALRMCNFMSTSTMPIPRCTRAHPQVPFQFLRFATLIGRFDPCRLPSDPPTGGVATGPVLSLYQTRQSLDLSPCTRQCLQPPSSPRSVHFLFPCHVMLIMYCMSRHEERTSQFPIAQTPRSPVSSTAVLSLDPAVPY